MSGVCVLELASFFQIFRVELLFLLENCEDFGFDVGDAGGGRGGGLLFQFQELVDVLYAGGGREVEIQVGLEVAVGLELTQIGHGAAEVEAVLMTGAFEGRVVLVGLRVIEKGALVIADDAGGGHEFEESDGLEGGLKLLGELVVTGSEDLAEGDDGVHGEVSFPVGLKRRRVISILRAEQN